MMRVACLSREGMRKTICSLITKKDFIYQYSSFYLIDNCAYRQGSEDTVTQAQTSRRQGDDRSWPLVRVG